MQKLKGIPVKLNTVVDTVLESDYLVYANNFEIKNLTLKTIFFMLEKIIEKFIFMVSSICICCFFKWFYNQRSQNSLYKQIFYIFTLLLWFNLKCFVFCTSVYVQMCNAFQRSSVKKRQPVKQGTQIKKKQTKITETNIIHPPSPYAGPLTTLLLSPLQLQPKFNASYSAWEMPADWYTVITQSIYLFFFAIQCAACCLITCCNHPNLL